MLKNKLNLSIEELFLDYTCHLLSPEYYKTTTTADS